MPRVAGGGYSAEGWGAEEVVRKVEIWMVEKIKGLGAKLEIKAFAERGVLQQRDVDVLKAWTIENVSARVAERARC